MLVRENARARDGAADKGTGMDDDAGSGSSSVRVANTPDNFRLTFLARERTTPTGSSSVGVIGGVSSSGIGGTLLLETFSTGRRMAPSLGPQSGPRNSDSIDPRREKCQRRELLRPVTN